MSYAGYVLLKQDESDSSDYGDPPPPVTSTSWLASRRWRRVVMFGSVGSLLVLLGFALCRLYSSWNKAASASCCDSTFDYNSFYGIPKDLPIINGTDLANHTELDLQTGFNVSDVPTIRRYTFNITQALSAPDGFQKPMILINNQFPGPLIEANTGDTVQVKVNNLMSNWSTTVHWHGIDQKNSTWMDGVAAVSQCGIPPNESFTYNFTIVDQRGTFWYHSHLSVQYTDGLFGPIVIHDPDEWITEVDEQRIVFMGDWYHTYASLLVASYLNPTSKWVPNESGVEALADNLLLNGKNTYDCSINSTTFPPNHDDQPTPPCDPTQASNYVTNVKSGKTYRLRLINHSTFFSFWFSIDNHTISIVEIDGVEISPIPFRGVYVNIAQRYSIIVRANQTVGNYYMRATLPTTCFLPYVPYSSMGLNFSSYFNVTGILSYDDTDPTTPPIGVAGNTSNPSGAADNPYNYIAWEGCNDMNFSTPVPLRVKPAYNISSGVNMHYIEFAFRQAQNINRIFINKTSWSPLENNATLWKTIGQDFSETGSYNNWGYKLDQQMLLLNDTGANEGAQIVINSLDAMEHPWHMHGHEFQIVGWGKGKYGQEPSTTEWKLSNPMRRDTVSVPAQSHIVLRILADNPGIWALHCHVAWHMEDGMFVQILERPIELVNFLDNVLPPNVKKKSMSFCYKSGDQSFGTEAQWRPEDLVPSGSISDVTATVAVASQNMGESGVNEHKQAGEFK